MRKVTNTFLISLAICIAFTVWGVIPSLGEASLSKVTNAVQSFLVGKFGWFYVISVSLFLGFAIYLRFSPYGSIRLGKQDEKPEYSYLSWFAMFGEMGGVGLWLSVLAIVLISTFFITSADSATFVLGMLASNGKLNPSGTIKLVWGIVQSLLACVLLYIGGLAALQTASIIAAFPFTFVILFMCASLMKELKKEKIVKYVPKEKKVRETAV